MIDERDPPEDIGGQALLSVLLLEGLLPGGRGELEDAALRPVLEEAEQVAEVGPGLDAVELAAGEQGHEDRVDAGALVAAEEEPVFAAEDLAPQVLLGDVVVQRQPAVVEESAEGGALVAGVAARLVATSASHPRERLDQAHELLRVEPGDDADLHPGGQLDLEG